MSVWSILDGFTTLASRSCCYCWSFFWGYCDFRDKTRTIIINYPVISKFVGGSNVCLCILWYFDSYGMYIEEKTTKVNISKPGKYRSGALGMQSYPFITEKQSVISLS